MSKILHDVGNKKYVAVAMGLDVLRGLTLDSSGFENVERFDMMRFRHKHTLIL